MPMPAVTRKPAFRWTAGAISVIVAVIALIFTMCGRVGAIPVFEKEYNEHVDSFEEHKSDAGLHWMEQRSVNREVMRHIGVPEERIDELENGAME